MMTEAEIIARGLAYSLFFLAVIAGSVHFGWQLRERLAHKIEFFGITQRRWREYDQHLKTGELPSKENIERFPVRESQR